MANCGHCSGDRWSLLIRHFGRCSQCIQLSALGVLVAWFAVPVTWHVVPLGGVQAITLLAAFLLSALFLAHAVAFTRRASAFERAVVFNAAHDAGRPFLEDRMQFLRAGGIDLAALLLEPIMLATRSVRSFTVAAARSRGSASVRRSSRISLLADSRPGDNCVKDEKKGPKFILGCKGTCFPLFDKQGKKYPGACKLIKKSNGKRPVAYECLCIYDVTSDCKIQNIDPGKPSEHLECVGDCPPLHLTDPTKDKKATAVESECTMIEQSAPGGGIEFVCICIYF